MNEAIKQHIKSIEKVEPIQLSPYERDTPMIYMDFGNMSTVWKQQAPSYRPDWVKPINSYPGLWARVSNDYFEFVKELALKLAPYFGASPSLESIKRISCNYAIATKLNEELHAYQTIPHFDNLNSNQIALVHYLCGGEFGGTGFYQHKSTGVKEVISANHDRYRDHLDIELSQGGYKEKQYISSHHPLFDRTHYIEAEFGRIVAFPSTRLHSACLAESQLNSDVILDGRLTITSFIIFDRRELPNV
ncbi:hypothetical protein CTT31_06795 [Pseudoalteromonas maricaloris]|uniref:DUF6445 family protein n=1 Tax=Pseudoalteromonas maricaloris TaxID=184924 RepID=UPI0021AD913A|nr:DUF6445 family protein [Pseudoalteromonas flavipulchra]USE68847.1 hypothetical protein CTT31_06795 [Pseudoalteromonas flavipulchra]